MRNRDNSGFFRGVVVGYLLVVGSEFRYDLIDLFLTKRSPLWGSRTLAAKQPTDYYLFLLKRRADQFLLKGNCQIPPKHRGHSHPSSCTNQPNSMKHIEVFLQSQYWIMKSRVFQKDRTTQKKKRHGKLLNFAVSLFTLLDCCFSRRRWKSSWSLVYHDFLVNLRHSCLKIFKGFVGITLDSPCIVKLICMISKPLKASGFETSCCGWDEVAARHRFVMWRVNKKSTVQNRTTPQS